MYLKKTISLFILVLVFLQNGKAQCVAPFSDLNGQLFVYDNDETHFLEAVPVLNMKVGKQALAYISNANRLRLYYSGKTYTIAENNADYYMTDNWFLFKNFSYIGVLYNNEIKTLDKLADSDLWFGDSLIVWTSTLNETKVFYNGQISRLEAWQINTESARIGDNIFAYNDVSGNFKVFYHGELKTIESYIPAFFRVDRDIVVYADYNGNFKFYYHGQSIETSMPLMPEYWTGEDFFAYYNMQGQLMVWYKGEEQTVLQDRPKDITIKENIIAFTDKGNNFYVWSKGKLMLMERFMPPSYKVDNDIVVYQDQDKRLKAYYFGKKINVSDQIATNFNLYNYTVTYSLIQGETSIWCDGKTTVH